MWSIKSFNRQRDAIKTAPVCRALVEIKTHIWFLSNNTTIDVIHTLEEIKSMISMTLPPEREQK